MPDPPVPTDPRKPKPEDARTSAVTPKKPVKRRPMKKGK